LKTFSLKGGRGHFAVDLFARWNSLVFCLSVVVLSVFPTIGAGARCSEGEQRPTGAGIPDPAFNIMHCTLFTAMASIELSKEDVLSQLSHGPRYILTGNITVCESAKLSLTKIQREPRSSIGLLKNLPLEILHAELNHLDLQSLSRVSRVSSRGKVVAKSLPAYEDLGSAAGHFSRHCMTRN
jgi:hypothetical protein